MEKIMPKKSLTEETYEILLDAICSGELEPGARLVQDEIAERLNVSRQPVNSAISILKTHRLVEDTGRRGVLVSEIDPTLFNSIYEFRSVVEPFALRLACERVGDAKSVMAAEAREVMALGDTAMEADDIGALVSADMRFHEMIYAWSGNEVIASSMRSNWHHIRRAMAIVLRAPGLPRQSWEDHAGIVDAVLNRDCPVAEAIMARHLSNAQKKIKATFMSD